MKKSFLLIIFSLLIQVSNAIVFTDSNLPIVIITTDKNPSTGQPYEIPDDPKVLATMKIIYRPDGSRNYMTDQNNVAYLNYNGRIGIEKRGSSSQDLAKKPYGLTTLEADNVTTNSVNILGMPKENDWVLNSLAFDPSLMRDYLSYELARNMGNYAARGVYCEVVINGDYKGLYVFMEKLKIDDDRINVTKMSKTDNAGALLTGGYVTKCDKTTGGDPVAWNMPNADFIHESPKPSDITSQQNTYIYNQFVSLKNTASASNASVSNGFPSVIDIPTFVDFMIMNELSSNADGYQFSTYFHKDRNGKLRAGPVWDFNLTYGNDLFDWGYDRSHTNVWQFNNGDNTGAKFWKNLFDNATFKCYLSKRWAELTATNQPLNYSIISKLIDATVAKITEAAGREQSRWYTVGTHATQISNMKTWLQTRISWLTTNLSSYQSCANVAVPALVISKINYNPVPSGNVLSDSLEFIEITNNSNATVNLTGVYFRELGLTYQFPVNSTIAAKDKKYLAASSKYFELIYGFKPFGQFTRNLSNDSEKLILADAFGNVIDYVEYSDGYPWPTDADGNGSFLELANLSSDNSLPSSWSASNRVLGFEGSLADDQIKIFPMPAQSSVTVYCAGLTIRSYQITDLMGRVIVTNDHFNDANNTINLDFLSPNVYLLKLSFDNGTTTLKKIIKQ